MIELPFKQLTKKVFLSFLKKDLYLIKFHIPMNKPITIVFFVFFAGFLLSNTQQLTQ